MVQGVREVFEITDLVSISTESAQGGEKENQEKNRENVVGKLVLIGRGLDEESWNESLLAFLKHGK